jgi:hypothetical protein
MIEKVHPALFHSSPSVVLDVAIAVIGIARVVQAVAVVVWGNNPSLV